jgi:hypothetical protein
MGGPKTAGSVVKFCFLDCSSAAIIRGPQRTTVRRSVRRLAWEKAVVQGQESRYPRNICWPVSKRSPEFTRVRNFPNNQRHCGKRKWAIHRQTMWRTPSNLGGCGDIWTPRGLVAFGSNCQDSSQGRVPPFFRRFWLAFAGDKALTGRGFFECRIGTPISKTPVI